MHDGIRKNSTIALVNDEMKVKSLYDHDSVTNRVLGLHSQMQVVMAFAASSLFSSWKQPIFVDFLFNDQICY